MSRRTRKIGLALQGGGVLGAYGWGVLDRLLEEEWLRITCLSGASAGAMNASVLAHGLAVGGRAQARADLETFWRKVADAGAFARAASAPLLAILRSTGIADGGAVIDALTRMSSPYDRPGFADNPLAELVQEVVNFETLRAKSPVEVVVSATDVATGRARLFERSELTAQVLAASACLPFLFRAIEIEGRAYWDGGFSANPSLKPFFSRTAPRDVVLVPLSDHAPDTAPRSADAIAERWYDVTFNAPLNGELTALRETRRIHGVMGPGAQARRVRLHRIDAGPALASLPAGAKSDTRWEALIDLRNRGRAAAQEWLTHSAKHVGRRESLDLEQR